MIVYDIVCIMHDVQCRMSTYDIVCGQKYDVVRLLEGFVPAVSKEPDPLSTAKANGLCLSYSKVFICSLATSKTVSETRSLWCPCTLKRAVVVVHRRTVSQVSEVSLEKNCKNLETHAHSKTRFQRQGPADLQPFRHEEKYIQCCFQYLDFPCDVFLCHHLDFPCNILVCHILRSLLLWCAAVTKTIQFSVWAWVTGPFSSFVLLKGRRAPEITKLQWILHCDTKCIPSCR